MSKRFLSPGILLLSLLVVVPASAHSGPSLPDAPQPSSRVPRAPVPDTAYAHSNWYTVVDPGESTRPLSPREKMLFWLHEEVSPAGWASALISTGYQQLTDGDPKYGSDSAAFGERLGAAEIRDASMRFFSDSLLPELTHEDPRYYRMARGSIKARGLFAAEQVFFTMRDDGSRGINYSDIVGHLAASALTPAYYPAPSANNGVVFETWAFSLVGDAAGNIFAEFWPDLRDAIFHRRRHSAGR